MTGNDSTTIAERRKSMQKKGQMSKLAERIRFIGICSALFFTFGMISFSYAADQALIDAVKKEGSIEVYDSFDRSYLDPQGALFIKLYKLGDNFKVNFTRKAAGAIIQMVEAERMSGKSRWDIVSHSEESTFLRWIEEGLLMRFQPANVGNIRKEFHDKHGIRLAPYIGMSSLAVNKCRVPEKDWPKTYKDLLDPKWKGRIGLADPNKSGPVVMFTKFMTDLYGWDYFKGLGKNQLVIAGGNPALEQLLLSVEVDMALCPIEYSLLVRIKKGETNIKIIYPEEGAGYFVQWRAINKDAPHPNAAKLWMEFSASDELQHLIAESAARYITSNRVKQVFERPEIKFRQIDWEWLKVHKDDMCKKFTEEVNKGRKEGKN